MVDVIQLKEIGWYEWLMSPFQENGIQLFEELLLVPFFMLHPN